MHQVSKLVTHYLSNRNNINITGIIIISLLMSIWEFLCQASWEFEKRGIEALRGCG